MARLGEEGAICVGPLGVLEDLVPMEDQVSNVDGQLVQDNLPMDDEVLPNGGMVVGDGVPISSQIQITNT